MFASYVDWHLIDITLTEIYKISDNYFENQILGTKIQNLKCKELKLKHSKHWGKEYKI